MPHSDPQRRREYAHAYHLAHREEHRATSLAYYQEHRSEILAYVRERDSTPEAKAAKAAYDREYRRKNRALLTAREHARRRGIRYRHTLEEWEAKKAEYDQRCAWCGESKPLERDHVIPVRNGDPETVDRIENIVPSCRSCNNRRNGEANRERVRAQAKAQPRAQGRWVKQ